MTKQEIESAVIEDYLRVRGKVIWPKDVDGYLGEHSADQVTLDTGGAVPFVVLDTPADCIVRWMDEFCDPVYDVEPLERQEFDRYCRPKLGDTLRGLWTYGHSYELNVGRLEQRPLSLRLVMTPASII